MGRQWRRRETSALIGRRHPAGDRPGAVPHGRRAQAATIDPRHDLVEDITDAHVHHLAGGQPQG